MAKDNEYPTSDVHPVEPAGATGNEQSTEDPLVELARIVNRNRLPGASAGGDRVGNTDYFAGLEDMGEPASATGVRSQSVEPEHRVEPNFEGAQPYVQPEPREFEPVGGGFAYPEARAADPSYDTAPAYADTGYDDVPVEPAGHEASLADEGAVSGHFELDIPETRLDSGISLDLESNLTAELEDELMGAFRQSYEPAVSGVSSDVVSGNAAFGNDETAAGSPAYEPAPEMESAEADAQAAEADYGFPEEQPYDVSVRGSYTSEEPAEAFVVEETVARPDPQPETASYRQESYAREAVSEAPVSKDTSQLDQSLEDDLFAALDSLAVPRASTPQAPPAVEQFQTSFDPYARVEEDETAEPAADDIDDMAWPAAAAALPDAVEDETLPPPEGYDLDAVARAMQESDPTLGSAGVLPPHPKEEKAAAPHPGSTSRKGLYAAAAVLAVAVVGGGAFFFMDGSGVAVPDGPPPVIAGLEGPLKIYPEAQSKPDDSSSKLIYDRVGSNADTSRERLVLPETTEPARLPPAPDGTTRPDPLVPGAPKKVRTLVVRPDGTIVSEPDGANANAPRTVSTDTITPAPVSSGQAVPAPATPSVAAPAVPTQTPAIVAAASPDTDPAASQTEETPVVQANVPSVLPKKKPAAPVQVARATSQPAARADGPLDLTSAPARSAPAAPQPAAPVAVSSGGTIPAGTYVVQVTSQRSEEAARNAYSGLQRKYAGILGNRSAVIVAANIQDRGTFYRARIPMSSRNDAVNLCESLQAAGGDCFVRRN